MTAEELLHRLYKAGLVADVVGEVDVQFTATEVYFLASLVKIYIDSEEEDQADAEEAQRVAADINDPLIPWKGPKQ